MANVPFLVVCTSCESILEVRNTELIGQVVACPKCRSMVLIEQTNQVRHTPSQTTSLSSTSHTAGTALPKESPDSALLLQTPDTSITQNIPHSSSFNATFPDEFVDESVGKNQLGELAEELQTRFLSNGGFDIWQQRRLILVAVGTICLLTLFVAFLLLRSQPDVAITEIVSGFDSENRNDLPQVPTGIEATQTGSQPDHQQPDTSLSHEGKHEGDHHGTQLLPSADEIKVEGHSEGVGLPTDTNDIPSDIIVDPSAESTQPEQSSHFRSQGTAAVKVPTPLTEQLTDDPFGDFDNIIIDNIIIDDDDGTTDRDTDIGEGVGLDTPPDKQSVVPDGFAGFIDENTVSTDFNGRETPSDATLLDSSDASETQEEETVDLKEIDIHERLTLTVASIHFDKAPIVDVVRALSNLSGIPMQLDVDELRARNISIETPVSLQLQGTPETTIAEIIDAVLQKTRLTRHDGNGWLAFGYTEEQVNTLRTARYDMSRLASLEQNPISPQQAADWLSQLLAGRTQNPEALHATVAVDGNESGGNAIVVVGSMWLQDQAKRLFQSLFYLRGLEPENGMLPERLAPEVFGWDRVNVPLSFNLVEPIPLKQAVWLIERQTQLRILIDHAALHDEELAQESQVTSRVSDGTIDTVLRGMLEPLGLTYRIVEANAVEITTPRVARQKMTIELHQFAPLPDGQTPESCAEALRQTFVETANWNVETGRTTEDNICGAIVIDSVSGYMLVRQDQPLQRDIRLWFGCRHGE